jgi:hypothetical protein
MGFVQMTRMIPSTKNEICSETKLTRETQTMRELSWGEAIWGLTDQ